MNAFLSLDGIELWHLAGWTMVHFLWLGALVVAAAAVGRFLLRRTSPSIRYAFMCAWLLALAALPFGTAAWLYQNSPPLKGGAGGGTVAVATPTPATPSLIELHQPELDATAALPPAPLASGASPNLSPQTTAPPRAEPSPFGRGQGEGALITVSRLLQSLIPYLPWLWLIGTPITFALLITGVVGTRRLNRASQPITEGTIAALLSQLTESLRISRRVTVAVCDRIAAPVLIGIIRPVILLPPAALTGWSPDEIEMVLLHELAHVRRWDNLMNLLQRVVESLLFFHPAVWIVSSWVRSDREACCDALVVRRTNRPHAYAEMLVALAAQMPRSVLFHPAASSAMAAGPLRSRIRRILQLEDDPMLVSGKSFVLVLAALAVVATLGVLYVPTIGQAEQSATENAEKKQEKSDAKSTEDSAPEPVRIPFKFVLKRDKSGRTRLYMNDQPVAEDVVRTAIGAQGKFVGKLQVSLSAEKGINHGEVKRVVDLLDSLGVKQISMDTPGVEDAHHLPPVPPTNDMLTEALSKNNMKTISIAALNYNEQHKRLPPHAIYSADGKPLLSWRVALLPYLGKEEQELYKQFHLDEPWDSDHNRKLVASIPILYVISKAGLPPVYAGKTNYLAVVGPECVFDGTAKGRRIADITDGTSNTIAFVEANVDDAVEWTKPDDWNFDRQAPTRGLGTVWTGHWNASYVDGSQHQISNDKPADAVGIQFTRAGGEQHSLQESLNRPTSVEGAVPGAPPAGPEGGPLLPDGASSKFPSLEDQKLADLAWKRLNLELEPIANDDLKLVKALGYDGGVKVVSGSAGIQGSNERIQPADILVGLHVWPTISMKDVSTVLDREDLSELNPLKFYVVRHEQTGPPSADKPNQMSFRDVVHTGRLNVQTFDSGFGGSRVKPTRNAPSTSSDAWPSTPATNTWPPANPNDVWQSAPVAGLPLEPAFPQGTGGAPATQPVHVNELPGVAKYPFQMLPTAPALNSNDASVSPPGTAPVLAPPPTDSYAVPPPATLNVPGAALPSEPTSIAAEAPPAGSILRQRTTPNGQVVYESFPSTTAPSDKSNLRYDGKTFDEWRTIWQTELSTEKRLEGIKALAAFGRAGYGKEATETILDVAGEYDFYILEGDQAPEGKLKETVLDELIPPYRASNLAQYWVPEVVARMKKDSKKWQWLAEHLFTRLRTKDPDVIAKLQLLAGTESPDIRRMALYALVNSDRLSKPGASVDKKTQDLIDAALESKNAEMIRSTLSLLPYYSSGMGGSGRMGGGGGMASTDSSDLLYRPALLPLLLDSDEQVRRQARQVASNITEQDSGDVIKYLLGVLKDKSRERDHLEAVRALAAVARRGGRQMVELGAVAKLREICKNSDTDQQMFVAAHVALLGMFPPDGAMQGGRDLNQLEKLYGGSSEEELKAIANRFNKMRDSGAADIQKESAIIFNNADPNTPSNPGGGFF